VKLSIIHILIGFLLLFGSGCSTRTNQSSEASGAAHTIKNEGSDTMVNLALAWAEQYQVINPDINISVSGGGSGTGITSLINGTTDVANASREMKPIEYEEAMKNGITPEEIVVARDAIAVIVNPSNPIDKLTLQQISGIYKGEINNWKEVGGENLPIVRLSRETNSGTHVYFLDTVVRLGNSDDKSIFSPTTLLLPSSEGIISEVRDNPHAIGYDGLGYITDEVKMIAVATDPQSPYIIPSVDTVNNNQYPISRDLYIYKSKNSKEYINKYINWILSSEAQDIVLELGFVPIIAGE
jgi:phosphate transport system substrate-binding protein